MAAAILIITGAVALILTAVLSRSKHCPDSWDGSHEYIRLRTPEGFRLQCCRCGAMTKGIAAFHRKA